MHHVIKGGSAFASLQVELEPGEWLKAEKNAMVAMSGALQLNARMDGGFLRGLARKFSGESFYFQTITATDTPGWAMLAPPMPGAITAIELHGKTVLHAEKNTFLAATSGVEISTALQRPMKALFGGSSFTAIKATGPGIVFLSSFGAIEPVTLMANQEVLVDTAHLMAWDDSVTYHIGKGGTTWSSALLGGEGLVARMAGPGRLWIQSRQLDTFRQWLGTLLPQEEKSAKSKE